MRDPDWTDEIVTAITEKLDSLSINPYLSEIYKQPLWGEVREALAGSHRLFFVVNKTDQVIQLRAILHVRQQDPDFSE